MMVSTVPTRRRALAALCALAAGTAAPAGVLSACVTSPREAGPSLKVDHPVTVTMLTKGMFAGPGANIQRQMYETVFRPAQPNVSIDFEAAGVSGAEYIAKLVSLTVAGTPPDVLYSGLADMPSLVAKSVNRPLDDLVKADTRFKPDDFFDVHWNAWKFQGKQRGLPWQGGPLVTYYNKNLFDAAGAAMPTDATWTWDAWRDAGNKLKRAMPAGDTPRWPTEVGNWQPWIYDSGGDVLDKAMAKCRLDSQPALAGFQAMADFIHRDQIAPKPQDVTGQTNTQMFMNSTYAIILMNRQGASTAGFVQPWVAVALLRRPPARNT